MRHPFQPVVHLELHTGDLPGARDFYGRLCGWSVRRTATRHGCYHGLDLASAFTGGLVQCATERALWLPYVQVDDVRAATQRAAQLGAAVLLGPREGPAGWRSVISSGSGGELALWQPKR